MKIPSNNLISLLRLLDGRMAAPDADLLRASLKSDPALKHRWRLLEKACQETEPQAQSAVLPLVEPETLAAFVEGALPADEAAEVEAACWQSTTLLREIRSVLRFRDEPNGIGSVPDQLTHRLLKQWPLTNESVKSTPVVLADEPRSVSLRRREKKSLGNKRLVKIVAGLAVCTLIAVTVIAFTRSITDQGRPVGKQEEPKQPDNGKGLLIPNPSPSPQPQDFPLVQDNHEPTKQPIFPQNRLDKVVDNTEQNNNVEMKQDDTGPTEENYLKPSPARPVVNWERVLGLLAIADARLGRWFGVESSAEHGHDAYISLPESWCESKTEGWGKLVLAADSMFSVEPPQAPADTSLPPRVRITVHYGRVGIHEMTPGQSIEFQVGQHIWQVKPLQEDTSLAIEVKEKGMRAAVVHGAAMIDGQELTRGQQVIWNPVNGMSAAETVRDTILWMEKPKRTATLSNSIRKKLLASDDLKHDLIELAGDKSSRNQGLLIHWTLSLFPLDSFEAAIQHPDPRVRHLAMNWLKTNGPRDIRCSRTLRALGASTGKGRRVAQLSEAIGFLHEGQPLPQPLANVLVACLRNEEFSIRTMAGWLLAASFGDRVPYDPSGNATQQQQASGAWMQILQRIYRAN